MKAFHFEVGDIVTLDGVGEHLVISHNGTDVHAADLLDVVCIKAPRSPLLEGEIEPLAPWCDVGARTSHVASNCELVRRPGPGEAFSSLLLDKVRRDSALSYDELSRQFFGLPYTAPG